jgi:hypothetical protein
MDDRFSNAIPKWTEEQGPALVSAGDGISAKSSAGTLVTPLHSPDSKS